MYTCSSARAAHVGLASRPAKVLVQAGQVVPGGTRTRWIASTSHGTLRGVLGTGRVVLGRSEAAIAGFFRSSRNWFRGLGG